MTLTTPRLLLAPVSMDHLPDIHALHSFPEVDRYNTLGIPASMEVTGELLSQWIRQQESDPVAAYTFSLYEKESNQFTGLIGLKMGKPNYRSAELWYKLHPHQWNKGFASEAVEAILQYCFDELQLHRIEAGCAVDNTASIKVLEKAGMTREGRKRQILPIRGNWVDNYFYAILESDGWKQR
jgi:[ribosomal protein S5]-alanine N-acetyltransferase